VRRVPIPVQVDWASATARYRNGFLYVIFRKGSMGQRADRRQIAVDE
jgi:HSP20 family molecular chaperone IbpA